MIKVTIDGREINASEGKTILEVARANGINIPTLCYDERVKNYGACGLCVVEAEGNSKLLRACATEINPGMVIKTSSPRINESRKMILELLLSDHSGDCQGPCTKACPAHTDVQGYVGLIANRQYREAVELIKEKLPLPASIGRICPHPCETACRRQMVEEPISIANLKYYAADTDLNSSQPYIPVIKPASGKKVAIAGAGPAGLTVAYFLAREGHQVTIYDAMPAGGGMLRYGIPEYRLPKAILDKEINLIRQMGVNFKYNTRIGLDISLEQLQTENDAVFLGIGAWVSSAMRAKGEDLPGVLGGIDFLRDVAMHNEVKLGNTVAIVGGGNTAMDAARTSLRLGAKKVMVLYRRTRAEMPAEDIEILEAEEEGVEFRFLVAPLEILARDGKAGTIRLQKMQLGEPDSSGRRSPVPIPGEEETIEIDTIISAIGQKVNPQGMTGVALSKWGTIEADEVTMATNIPGVFAGGDGVTGPKIAIDAIAQGGRAARSINNYLNGISLNLVEGYTAERQLTPEDFKDYEKTARIKMPQNSPQERKHNFQEVNLGLSENDAVAEASRCLECGCKDYFECRLVKYAVDYKVEPERLQGDKRQEKCADKHPFIERNSEKCILCGLCMRICDEVMGVGTLGLVQRGFESVLAPEFNLPLNQTACINCGQCVAVCPTGALMEHYPVTKNLPLKMEQTQSVCSFCSVGCEPIFNSCGQKIYKALPGNKGLLCRQGRFAFETFDQERLIKPMVKVNGKLIETTWEEAYQKTGELTRSIKERKLSSALAAFISPTYTLEEASAAAGFARLALETSNLGSFTPYSTRGLAQVMGGEIPAGSFAELASSEVILMVGSLNSSQIAAIKVRQAVKAGARLIIISQEETLVDDIAAIKIVPEQDSNLLEEILAAVVKNNLVAEDFIASSLKGYDFLKLALVNVLPGTRMQAVAEIFARAKNAMIVVDGNEVTSAGVELLADLALITGKIASPGNGLIVVSPGSNHLGLWNLGITMSNSELKAALQEGKIKGLFIFGEDPAGVGLLSSEDLKQVELLVAVTPFMTATAELADIILPASTPVESAGTYISADRTVRKLVPIIKPLTGLTNQEIINALAAAMNISLSYNQDPEIAAAIARAQNEPDFTEKRVLPAIPQNTKILTQFPVPNPALGIFRARLFRDNR